MKRRSFLGGVAVAPVALSVPSLMARLSSSPTPETTGALAAQAYTDPGYRLSINGIKIAGLKDFFLKESGKYTCGPAGRLPLKDFCSFCATIYTDHTTFAQLCSLAKSMEEAAFIVSAGGQSYGFSGIVAGASWSIDIYEPVTCDIEVKSTTSVFVI